MEKTGALVEKAEERAESLVEKVKERGEPLVEKAEPLIEKVSGNSGKDRTS